MPALTSRQPTRFAVVQFPGTNCERETVRVLRDVLYQEVDLLWHGEEPPLHTYGCVILPGGFAHGDHLRSGAIARFSPIMRSVTAFARDGGLTLGICNGFQVLLEAGLLPGAMRRNASLQFRSQWVWCRVERVDTAFTNAYAGGQLARMPIAHGEGSYTAGSPEESARLHATGRIPLRYCDSTGQATAAGNPNGADLHAAGVINAAGNVFGLMPHPERASEPLLGSVDGGPLFHSIIRTLHGEWAPAAARGEALGAER